eukprot:1393890-Amorphochlora_amoeboformis.AAC.1
MGDRGNFRGLGRGRARKRDAKERVGAAKDILLRSKPLKVSLGIVLRVLITRENNAICHGNVTVLNKKHIDMSRFNIRILFPGERSKRIKKYRQWPSGSMNPTLHSSPPLKYPPDNPLEAQLKSEGLALVTSKTREDRKAFPPKSSPETRVPLRELVGRVEQKEAWDCGLACGVMAL